MFNKKNTYLDIHIIQTLPPSCINRDDSGSPKTSLYGGARRARISSQAWKRSMRKYFEENCAMSLGLRTKHIVEYIAQQICEIDSVISIDEAEDLAYEALTYTKVQFEKDKKSGKPVSKALFFLGKEQSVCFAESAIGNKETIMAEKKKDWKKKDKTLRDLFERTINNMPEVDIALFGRMVADNPSLSIDASSQVAHAISTHAVQVEFDYFTALDDLQAEEDSGAAMLDTTEYDSSTVYRYANIAVHELLKQLNDKSKTVNTTKLFIEAFSNSMPTGKINSFANQTLPQAIMINIREDRPVNLVTAYEKPVTAKNGYSDESIRRLLNELEKSNEFVRKPTKTICLIPSNIGPTENIDITEKTLSNLLKDVGKELEALL